MTLDEKIGQMLELNLDLVGSVKVKGDYKIDRKKLLKVLQQFGNTPQCQIDEFMKLSDAEVDAKLGRYGLDIYEGNPMREWTDGLSAPLNAFMILFQKDIFI